MESSETLVDIPGVPESALSAGLAGQLPKTVPGPPWRCRMDAVVWCHRASGAGADALPDTLRDRAAVPLTVGMMVRYRDTPVGPYMEVAASPYLLRGRFPQAIQAHVPFIAVDSLASLHGGRANWALPKARAEFSGYPADRIQLNGTGEEWHVDVRPRARGPRFPVAAASGVTQVWADGSALSMWAWLAGLGRFARVETDVASTGPLARWLRPGPHPGVLITGARLAVGPPR